MLRSVSIHSLRVLVAAVYQRGLDPVAASDRKLGIGFSIIGPYQTMCFDTHLRRLPKTLPAQNPYFLRARNR
jgi:hypothetical protein